jgi:Na+/phosphate symporter
MDTSSLKEQIEEVKESKADSTKEPEKKESKKIENLDNKILAKDEEIKALKQKLADAQKSNKAKVGDIRAETNRMGDVAKICVGVDENGRRLWKKATDLTDADIKRREEYINSIKQLNARKNY